MTKDNIFKNKVKAINKRNRAINEVLSEIFKYLKENEGEKLVKVDGTLLKKHEALKALCNKKIEETKRLRMYLDPSMYSLWLNSDINYMVSDVSCEYAKKSIYICDIKNGAISIFRETFEPLPIYNEKKIKEELLNIKEKREKIKELKKELSELKSKVSEFY